MDCNSSSNPLALEMVDIWVGGTASGLARAIQIDIGTPGQAVHLFVRSSYDDVIVINDNVPINQSQYPFPLGLNDLGLYNWAKSSTFSVAKPPTTWNGSDTQVDTPEFTLGYDTLQVGDQFKLEGCPIITQNNSDAFATNTFPLTSDSVMFKSLVATGQVISHVVGYWPGSRGTPQGVLPQNAPSSSLVLGGYDGSLVSGNTSTTISFNTDCSNCINITTLTYNDLSGSVNLLKDFNETFSMFPELTQPDLQLFQAPFEGLLKATNGTYNGTAGRIVYPARPPGNLTVTLSNGYTTVIPNEELFAPLVSLSENGSVIENQDTYIALAGNDTRSLPQAFWGRPYFSMNYAVLDFSRNQLILYPIYTDGIPGQDLVPICDARNVSSGHNTTGNHTIGNHTGSNHTGAITGGVVGGVVGAALFLALVVFWLRKRRQARKKDTQGFGDKPELDGTQTARALKTDLEPRSELDSAAVQELHQVSKTMEFI
ncbi:hypothetical protein NA57DRAFT_61254 [Rhizodiscina lignyota]|uniref:Peptidase A1 domain-containing protein n=1 Tax=Rhizodiscina lignyota TaxID=1504668 RepID=A0A9P4M569_9PEZI|nr:hypothetical protein NA57DRAFT_61254 [Rhizodiscina lignyota]